VRLQTHRDLNTMQRRLAQQNTALQHEVLARAEVEASLERLVAERTADLAHRTQALEESLTRLKIMIPSQDYERITLTIKAILDSENAAAAHACQFFALMGGAILYRHYGIQARPVFGAAFLMLDNVAKDVLSYGKMDSQGAIGSDANHYHAWLETDEYVIDFMAPIYGDAMRAKGYTKEVPRWMLQRRRSSLAPDAFQLRKQGDCLFMANETLSQRMLMDFLSVRMYQDLVRISTEWYRKPPEPMLALQTSSAGGQVRSMRIGRSILEGEW